MMVILGVLVGLLAIALILLLVNSALNRKQQTLGDESVNILSPTRLVARQPRNWGWMNKIGGALGGILKFAAIVAILWVAIYYFPTERFTFGGGKINKPIKCEMVVVRPFQVTPVGLTDHWKWKCPKKTRVYYLDENKQLVKIVTQQGLVEGYVEGPDDNPIAYEFEGGRHVSFVTFEPFDSRQGQYSFVVKQDEE